MKRRKKNWKKIYLIAILVIILLFILFYYLFTNVTITLNGDNPMMIEYGSKYYEEGFRAINGFGYDVSEHVTINSSIDEYQEGKQVVEYVYQFGGITEKVTREVQVLENPFKEYSFVINGDKLVYVTEKSLYEDPGAYVVKLDTNTIIEDIEVKNSVNTSIPGEYDVIYSFTKDDAQMVKKRKVIVLANDEKIITSNDRKTATIKLDFSKIVDYQKTVLPNGKEVTDPLVEFEIIANGEYRFAVYDSDKQVLNKHVSVDLLANSIQCIGKIKVSGTYLSIINNLSKITTINWGIDDKYFIGGSEIRIDHAVKSAYVNIVLEDKTIFKTTCSIQSDLAYSFRYDEMNTKEYMNCNTYSSQDKITLDKKLSQAVNDAGYGTRAGVVEAARFLVGGLDYKVRYLGPKSGSSTLGMYPKPGLNIAQKGAWGCTVDGWVQGMDCTNFVIWAFKQNGLYPNGYYSKTDTYRTREVVDKLQVGDFLLTPCEENCVNPDFVHIGIIIGIDDESIYVAESTTGSIDAIVVSKYAKNNMPQKGYFSYAKLYKYAQDGDVTNMWMSN